MRHFNWILAALELTAMATGWDHKTITKEQYVLQVMLCSYDSILRVYICSHFSGLKIASSMVCVCVHKFDQFKLYIIDLSLFFVSK